MEAVLFYPKVDPKAAIWRKSVFFVMCPMEGEGETDGGRGGTREKERERRARELRAEKNKKKSFCVKSLPLDPPWDKKTTF